MLREINRRLHKTFITPIDPEDIHRLSALIDEILDHLDAAAYRIEAFGLERSSDRVKNPDELARRCEANVADLLEGIAVKNS